MTAQSPRFLHDRYVWEQILSRNNELLTWLGRDVPTGEQVIIRSAKLHTSSGQRLEKEAELFQKIRSPHLAPYRSSFILDGYQHLVLGYVTGRSLEERIHRAHQALSVQEGLLLARCILSALDAIHSVGILHRDIKPSNIMINQGETLASAVLIDFNLALELTEQSPGSESRAGTALYMPPEQSGLINRPLSPASDLYSFGIVLYEALAGERLFKGSGIGEVLREHLTAQLPDLRSTIPGFPNSLSEIIRRLLQKDPLSRYQSARAVLGDIEAIERAMESHSVDAKMTIGGLDHRTTLAEPAFSGRETEMRRIKAEVQRVRKGEGSLILLEGESGQGKTRLLNEIAIGYPFVLRGQGVTESGQQPFQLFSGIIQALLAEISRRPQLGQTLRRRLTDHLDAIVEVFPQLGQSLETKKTLTLGPENLGAIRSVQALSSLLSALGTPQFPALVILDDCQWGDELSQMLLAQWEAERNAVESEQCLTTIVAAFRSEEVALEHPLRSLRGSLAIKLAPLSPAEIRSMLESMAGKLPQQAIHVVTRLSEGNPFMVLAVLQGLIESRGLIADSDSSKPSWKVDPLVLTQVQSSTRAAIFLSKRLFRFPSSVLEPLKVGAVLGKSFDIELAAQLAGMTTQDALKAVDEARRRKVVWIDTGSKTCTFVHDRIRESLLELLDIETRKRLHLRAATEIERSEPSRIYDLAYHFDSASESHKALPYAMEAAENARARYSLEVAENYYRIAARGAQDASPEIRKKIARGLGEVLMLRGKYPEAVERLNEALRYATETFDQAQILGTLGELAFKRSLVQEAANQCETALKLLRWSVPKNWVLAKVVLLWEILVQAVHSLAPTLILPRKNSPKNQAELLAIRLLMRLSYCYWYGNNQAVCLWTHFRAMNVAERYPNSPELAQAYSHHAPAMSLMGWYSRGIRYAQRSIEIRKSLGDIWGQGQSLNFLAVLLLCAGKNREMIETCTEAIRLLERTGDRWEVNTGNWSIAFANYRLGNFKAAVEFAEVSYRDSLALGDFQNAVISLSIRSLATQGDVSLELIDQLIEKNKGDFATLGVVAQAKGMMLLKQGDTAGALQFLTQAWDLVSKKGIMNGYVFGVVPWLLTAIRQEIEKLPVYEQRRRNELIRRARRLIRRYRWHSRLYRNDLPHFLREEALLAMIWGDAKSAWKHFHSSLKVAQEIEAKYEIGLTEQAMGRVGQFVGWPESEQRLAAGNAAIFQLEILSAESSKVEIAQGSLSLQDRFSSILTAGRRLALALTLDEVYRAIHWTALHLVRGEFFGLIEIQEQLTNGKYAFRIPESDLYSREFSVTLADQAIESKTTVIYNETDEKRATESLVIQGAQATLYTPVFVHGKPKLVFFVGHTKLSDLYGENEKQLAEFISVLAGAALENCEGVQEIHKLSNERAKALQARDEFLSIASHELKTPLTSLRLQIELLLNTISHRKPGSDFDSKLERILQIIDHQGVRLTRLIENLLDLTRIEAGRLQLNLEKLDMKHVVAEVIERFREELTESRYDLRFESEDGLFGNWDRFRIEQVIINLLHNAVKYGRGKPIFISLKKEGGYVILTIQDQGVGIPKEHQERIFEQYERVANPINVTGLGLGLYIVKKTVLAHGGTVRVESAPNQGSKFIVSLPALEKAKKQSPRMEDRMS